MFISEITIAELKVGAFKSDKYEQHNNLIQNFIKEINILKVFDILKYYASERTRLEKAGNKIDNFDLLIGATSIANELILVTNNTKLFQRMSIKHLEDWTI